MMVIILAIISAIQESLFITNPPLNLNNDSVHRKIEESQLFIEAAHACYAKMMDIEKKELSGKAI